MFLATGARDPDAVLERNPLWGQVIVGAMFMLVNLATDIL
jgi:hypothetical protein